MRSTSSLSLATLLAGVLTGGACGLDGLVFDRAGEGQAGSASTEGEGGGSTASSSSSGGAGGLGGFGGGDVIEDCQNGQDDDGDGLTDCNDEDCSLAGYSCVEIPPGWIGPVALYRGPLSDLQSCPEAYPLLDHQGSAGLQFDPASCSPCACSAPGASCQGHGWQPYGNQACTQAVTYNYSGVSGSSCGWVTGANFQSFIVNEVTVNVSGCAPSGGEPSLPPPSWNEAAVLCGGAQLDTCDGGSAFCAPPPQTPFHGGACIWKLGNDICPGGFSEKHLIGQEGDVTDTRDCSACSCPQQFSCLSTFNFYADSNCTQLVVGVPSDETCVPSPTGQSVTSYNVSWGPVSGSCPPVGGAPQGTVTPNNVITACCRP